MERQVAVLNLRGDVPGNHGCRSLTSITSADPETGCLEQWQLVLGGGHNTRSYIWEFFMKLTHERAAHPCFHLRLHTAAVEHSAVTHNATRLAHYAQLRPVQP